MLNSGKKFHKKNKYSNSRVVRKKKFLNEKKTIAPSLQVKWSVSNIELFMFWTFFLFIIF